MTEHVGVQYELRALFFSVSVFLIRRICSLALLSIPPLSLLFVDAQGNSHDSSSSGSSDRTDWSEDKA